MILGNVLQGKADTPCDLQHELSKFNDGRHTKTPRSVYFHARPSPRPATDIYFQPKNSYRQVIDEEDGKLT